jgi:hypothetical protein
MLQKYSVHDTIASYCTKCKADIDHVIMKMDAEAIAKVKCKTCGSTHRHRSDADARKTRRAKKEDTMTAEVLWQNCLAQAKGRESNYDMGAKYRVGDIVEHRVFGTGVVRKIYLHKCDVLFKDKQRLMASANS